MTSKGKSAKKSKTPGNSVPANTPNPTPNPTQVLSDSSDTPNPTQTTSGSSDTPNPPQKESGSTETPNKPNYKIDVILNHIEEYLGRIIRAIEDEEDLTQCINKERPKNMGKKYFVELGAPLDYVPSSRANLDSSEQKEIVNAILSNGDFISHIEVIQKTIADTYKYDQRVKMDFDNQELELFEINTDFSVKINEYSDEYPDTIQNIMFKTYFNFETANHTLNFLCFSALCHCVIYVARNGKKISENSTETYPALTDPSIYYAMCIVVVIRHIPTISIETHPTMIMLLERIWIQLSGKDPTISRDAAGQKVIQLPEQIVDTNYESIMQFLFAAQELYFSAENRQCDTIIRYYLNHYSERFQFNKLVVRPEDPICILQPHLNIKKKITEQIVEHSSETRVIRAEDVSETQSDHSDADPYDPEN
jgi:hypothetical protein